MSRSWIALTLFALSMVAIAALSYRAVASTAASDLINAHRFSFLEYELTHLPNHWLTEVAAWMEHDGPRDEVILQRWFERYDPVDRNRAERILERRLTETIRTAGLSTPLPLFNHQRVVWPPVDIEFSSPLRVLAVSPRKEIRLARSVLLEAELPRAAFADLEAPIETDGQRSALVLTVGGVALYPAIVVQSRDYHDALQIIAHEWTHHYLAFHPLGQAYARDNTMRTINETVSDIVGEELAQLAAARRPHPASAEAHADAATRDEIRAATDPILRSLRLEVDALLADGEIEAAEELMEQTRLELAAMGRNIRRINQAFFAFRGAYGASPASTTPWGDRLFRLRDRSPTLADFLQVIREVGSGEEAERLLNP